MLLYVFTYTLLTNKDVDNASEKVGVIGKVQYFVSCSLGLFVLVLYAFNPFSLSSKWMTSCFQHHTGTRRVGSLQNDLHDKGKGVREETIYVYFWIEYFSEQFISGT